MSRNKNGGLLRAATPASWRRLLPGKVRYAGQAYPQVTRNCKIPLSLQTERNEKRMAVFDRLSRKLHQIPGFICKSCLHLLGKTWGRCVLAILPTGALLKSWSSVLRLDLAERYWCSLLFLGYFQVWEKMSWLCFVDLDDALCKKANPSNIIGPEPFISISQTPMAMTEKKRWMKTMSQCILKNRL